MRIEHRKGYLAINGLCEWLPNFEESCKSAFSLAERAAFDPDRPLSRRTSNKNGSLSENARNDFRKSAHKFHWRECLETRMRILETQHQELTEDNISGLKECLIRNPAAHRSYDFGWSDKGTLERDNSGIGEFVHAVDNPISSAVDEYLCRSSKNRFDALRRPGSLKVIGHVYNVGGGDAPDLADIGHIDMSIYTIVYSTQGACLEFFEGGQWLSVGQCDCVVIFGWLLERLGYPEFHAGIHRVRSVTKRRVSLTSFHELNSSVKSLVLGGREFAREEVNVIKRYAGWRTRGCYGESLTHFAARTADVEMMRHLLRSPVLSGTERCALGRTPMHLAVLRGAFDVVNDLLMHGVCSDLCDAYGVTPLHLAYFTNNAAAVDVLLKSGASPDLLTKWGSSPKKWSGLHSSA